MAQKKKVPPTPQQHSSSEEEEVEATTPSEQTDSSEETSGEDEAPLAPVNKPTPPVEQHSSSSEEEVSSGEEEATPFEQPETSSHEEGEDEEDGSDDEEEVTPLAPVKPVEVRAKQKQQQQQPDLAPAFKLNKKKRPAETTAVSKKIKKKRVAEEVVKDYPKKPLFQRVFSKDDEIALLNALFDYSEDKCVDPIVDITHFHDFVKKYIQADVTSTQLSAKIKKMKGKYKKNATKKKETFGKAHDQSSYDLSKKIWGKSSSSASGGSELKTTRKEKRIPKTKNMTPGLQIPQVVEEPVPENVSWSDLSKTRDVVGMMCLTDDTFKKNLELLSNDEAARAALEDKLKNIVTAEVELTYKRLELSCELMKSSLDGHRG